MLVQKESKKEVQYKKIIIDYDEKVTMSYSFKTYNKYYSFLINIITKEEFNKIIDELNIIICDAKLKKSKFDKVEKNMFIYTVFILLSFIFVLAYIFLFYFTPRNEKSHKKLRTSGLIFFCTSIFILICLEIYNSTRKIQGDKTLLEFYKDNIINYINNQNIIWKDKLIFNFDEKTKNIICFIKFEGKNSNKDSNNISNNVNTIDRKSIELRKSYSEANLYSNIKNEYIIRVNK